MAITDLLARYGKQNMGGLKNIAHLIPLADLDDATPFVTSAAGKLDFSTNLVAKETKRFYQMYSTPQKGHHDGNSVGEVDGKSKENIYEFFYPGNEQECAEFEAFILNTPCVIVFYDPKGNKRVLGLAVMDFASTAITTEITCHLDVANSLSGAAYADLAGTTLAFKHAAPHPPLFYKGAAISIEVVV
jgi:hypothetical protein